MIVTAKSRYALKIMMDLAIELVPGAHSPRLAIAKRQGIPEDFIDHVLSRLRRAGLIESVRGRGGGFLLGRDPSEINVWDIFSAVEDRLHPVQCLEEQACAFEETCVSHQVWMDIFSGYKQQLMQKSLKKIVSDVGDGKGTGPVEESCRSGKSHGGRQL